MVHVDGTAPARDASAAGGRLIAPAAEVRAEGRPGRGHEPIQIGQSAVSFLPHYLPGIGPRVFLIIDEPSLHEALNLTTDDARRIADRLKLAACAAESMARRASRRKGDGA